MGNCGIYCIRNTVDGKLYIGSSLNIKRRWNGHRSQLRRGVHHSTYLQRAWNLYGAEAFAFEIVELVDEVQLVARETFHLQQTRPAYNLAPVGGSKRGMKIGPFTQEHRDKIGAAHRGKKLTPEQVDAMSKRLKGRVITPEWRAKLAASMTGKKLAPLTAEHKALVSSVHKGKTISAEHRAALSRAHKGRAQSEETRAKRSATIKAWWDAKKAQANIPTSHL